jgi:hypothetical protein
MCRSIQTLRPPMHEGLATEDEIRAAALQFVRKISGYRKPAAVNQDVFDQAVEEITASSRRLLDGLVNRSVPAASRETALSER